MHREARLKDINQKIDGKRRFGSVRVAVAISAILVGVPTCAVAQMAPTFDVGIDAVGLRFASFDARPGARTSELPWTEFGFGERLSIRIRPRLTIESAADVYIRYTINPPTSPPYHAHGKLEAVVGPTTEVPVGSLRALLIVRGGVLRAAHFPSYNESTIGKAFDLGTGIAVGSRGTTLRVEVGDVVTWYDNKSVPGAHHNFRLTASFSRGIGHVLSNQSQTSHHVFDRWGKILTAIEVGSLVADGAMTTASENDVNVREGDPIAMPFVNQGWPGMLVGGAMLVSADLLVRSILHHAGHHRYERLLPIGVSVVALGSAVHNHFGIMSLAQ